MTGRVRTKCPKVGESKVESGKWKVERAKSLRKSIGMTNGIVPYRMCIERPGSELN